MLRDMKNCCLQESLRNIVARDETMAQQVTKGGGRSGKARAGPYFSPLPCAHVVLTPPSGPLLSGRCRWGILSSGAMGDVKKMVRGALSRPQGTELFTKEKC